MEIYVNDVPVCPPGQSRAKVMGRKAVSGEALSWNARSVVVRIPALRGGGWNDVKRKLPRDHAA
jgi:hypothetical protein